jgi:hypothetical protein
MIIAKKPTPQTKPASCCTHHRPRFYECNGGDNKAHKLEGGIFKKEENPNKQKRRREEAVMVNSIVLVTSKNEQIKMPKRMRQFMKGINGFFFLPDFSFFIVNIFLPRLCPFPKPNFCRKVLMCHGHANGQQIKPNLY